MRLSMCVEFLSFMMLFMRGSFVFSVKQRYKFEASKNDKDVLSTDDLSCVIYSRVFRCLYHLQHCTNTNINILAPGGIGADLYRIHRCCSFLLWMYSALFIEILDVFWDLMCFCASDSCIAFFFACISYVVLHRLLTKYRNTNASMVRLRTDV